MRKLKNEELERKTVNEFHQAEKTPIVIVLDNVRSLNNIGSAFRTGDAFLITGIYLCGTCGTPPDKEIHKTALGATDTVPWKYFQTTQEAVAELKSQGIVVCAVEQADQSTHLQDFEPQAAKTYAFIFGNEVYGVDQRVMDDCDLVIEIPQAGSKHSFNISVSIGIVLWEVYKKIAAMKVCDKH